MGEYDQTVFAQIGYRNNKSMWGSVGVTFLDMGIMYGYEMTRSTLNTISSGSHEIMLYFDIDHNTSKYRGVHHYNSHQRHKEFRKKKS